MLRTADTFKADHPKEAVLEAADELWRLGRYALDNADVCAVIESCDSWQVPVVLNATTAGRELLRGIDAYDDRYHRHDAIRTSCAQRWTEDPTPMIEQLRDAMRSAPSPAWPSHRMRHQGVARHKPLALALAAALTACAMLVGVAAAEAKPGPPGPGNSPSAKACQKDQWNNYVTATGEDFTSEEACTSYAANGGTLVADSVVAPCLDGGWENLVTADGDPFDSEQECRSYAAQGGTLKPNYNALETKWRTTCINSGGSPYSVRPSSGTSTFGCRWSGSNPNLVDAATLAVLGAICGQANGRLIVDGGNPEDGYYYKDAYCLFTV